MNKFWNQTIEFKALIISLVLTILGFSGTAFLFWFNRYDVPLSILTSGLIIALTWFFLFLNKKNEKNRTKLDIVLIFLRLTLIVTLALLASILKLNAGLITISPIFLIVSYLVISLATLIAYFKKGENDA